MKKLLLFLFLLNVFVYSQCKLSGVIRDSENNQVLENVIVSLKSSIFNKQQYSDKNGLFEFIGLVPNKYLLEANLFGFVNYSNEIELSENQEKNIEIKLEQRHFLLKEIKVISTKFDKYLTDESLPLIIIDGKKLNTAPRITVSDFLKDEPGLSLIRDGIWGTGISIRGLSKSNIIVLIDGNRVETATDIAANMSLIDPSQLERIEVIKGSGSLLYGTGALGGVVNLITKKNDFSDELRFQTNFSSGFNSVNRNTNLFTGIAISSNKWFMDLYGGLRNASDVNTPSGEIKNSRFHDYNYSINFGLSPIENQKLKITYQKYQATDIGIPGASSLFPAQADVRYPLEIRHLFSVEYTFDKISSLLNRVHIKYYFQEIFRDVENITNQKILQPKRIIYNSKITPNAFHFTNGINIQSDWILANNNLLLFGIDIWQRRLDSRRERFQLIIDSLSNSILMTEKIIGERPLPEAKFTSIGGFLLDDWKLINDKFYLTFGARIDKILIENKEAYNPVYEIVNGVRNDSPTNKLNWTSGNIQEWSWSSSVSLLYRIIQNLDLTFSFSRSFRSPSLEERYQYIDQGNIIRLGNPELKPEESVSYDLGIKNYNDLMFFQTNIFLNLLNNLVIEDPAIIIYEGRLAKQKRNVSRAILYGIDFSIDIFLPWNFQFYINGSFVKAEDRDTKVPLPQIPPFNLKSGIKSSIFEIIDIEISADIFANQNYVSIGETQTSGYVTWDLNLAGKMFKFFDTDISLFAGIDNIFNREYRNHLSSNRGLITIEPGRNFFFKISFSR